MIVYSRALTRTLLALLAIGVLVISGTAWAAFSSVPYFPLADGLTWMYERDDLLTSTVIVIPGTVVVGSTATKLLQASTEGSCTASQTFNTSDEQFGIRLHKLFTPDAPIPNLGTRDVTITLNAPVVLANGMTDLGQSTGQQSGSAVVALSPPILGSPFNFTYSAEFTTAGALATRTVPAGTIPDLLQLNGTIMITGSVLGQPVNLTLSFTFYLGQDIGIVESTTAIGANSATIKLATAPPIPTHTLTVTCDPSGTPNPVGSGGTANLNVEAIDSQGHSLTYAWTADCPAALVGDGSFNSAALQTPTWTAPTNTTGIQQNCTIGVTVSDGQGQSQSPSYIQTVNSVQHQIDITSGPGGTPNPVGSGATANLSVAATDTFGHALTYAWTADCPAALVGDGSFNNASLQNPTWSAPTNTTGSQQNCTIQVTVSDGMGQSQSPSYQQGVNSAGSHTLDITSLPSGLPNPVGSGATANLSVAATDSLGHPLTYAWTADCPAALVGDGSFNNASLQNPTWTAPTNTTGIQQNCTIQVTVSDPGPVLSQSPSFSQGVSPEGGGGGPSEPPVPQLLNVMTLSGPGGSEQQTFLTSDPITAEVTFFDPNPACAGVAPVLLQLLFFNGEGQLILTREDVTSAPIAPGSKYRLLSANLAPGALSPGTYTLIFLVRDCTSVNIFVSSAYAIRVVSP